MPFRVVGTIEEEKKKKTPTTKKRRFREIGTIEKEPERYYQKETYYEPPKKGERFGKYYRSDTGEEVPTGLGGVAKTLTGIGEYGAKTASGALSSILGGIAGVASIPINIARGKGGIESIETAGDIIGTVREKGTFEPRTKEGQRIESQMEGRIMPELTQPQTDFREKYIEPAAEFYGQEFGPTAAGIFGAAAETAPELLAQRAGLKSIAKRAPKAPTLTQTAGEIAARERGIPVMTSDIKPPRTSMGKWAQSVTEKTPIAGTGGKRVAQYKKRLEATQKTLEDLGFDETADYIDETMTDLLETQGKFIEKWDTMKKDVIGRMADKGQIGMSKTLKTIDDEIAKLERISPEELAPAINRFERLKADIQGKTLQEVEQNRKLLSNQFKKDQGLAGVKDQSRKSLGRIYKSINEDFGDFIKENGEPQDFNRWKSANKKLSENRRQIEDSALKSILDKGRIDPQTIDRMLLGKSPYQTKLLMKKLSKEGKKSARLAVLNKVVKSSGGVENINPQRFATNISKEARRLGITFRPLDYQNIRGLQKALDYTKRAADAGVMTPTGMQTLPAVQAIALKAATGDWIKALLSGGTIGLAGRLYESPAFAKILRSLDKAQVGTMAETAAFESMMEMIRENKEEEKP